MSPATPQLEESQDSLSAVAIIPARLGSQRLPRKMLLRDSGRYLFEHTVRNLLEGGAVERVVLATDSDEILDAAKEVGIEALMTRSTHKSGTDRVQEAYETLLASGEPGFDVVVNVQGDEPDVAAEDLRTLIDAFREPAVRLATLWARCEDPAVVASPNAVKVVLDKRGDALYFTRASVPNTSHRRRDDDRHDTTLSPPFKRHVGVYAFRPEALKRFCSLPEGELEHLENLEQLRWLEAGERLRVLPAVHHPRGIDTAEDYLAFVNRQTLS